MRLSPAEVWLDSRLYKVSSIPPIIRFAAISPTASFALKELYHTHNAAVKETPPATSQAEVLLFCDSK